MSSGTTYRIAEAARRSGFSASTLRYYDDIGLVSPAGRTEAGYRAYDESSLARLAFVARAKQLGCTLEEITELVGAWEGDRCQPVQERLRALVQAKVGDAQHRMAELATFTAELQRAAAALDSHTPDGPCDDRCGCTAEGASPSVEPTRVALAEQGRPPDEATIACTLDGSEMAGRLDDWKAALVHVQHRQSVDGGLRLSLDEHTPLGDLAGLVAAEQGCCSFFSFALTVDQRGAALEVRAPAEAADLVAAVFGVAA